MLTNRGNNGNVVFGIGGIEEGVESTSPRRDLCTERPYGGVELMKVRTYCP